MNHLVLARKYRPRSLSEVVGQDIIVKTIKAALMKDRVAHALLFTGSRGVGKTTIARIVAKALVCLEPKEGEPCNKCHQCNSVDDFSSLDVMEIDGASHTGVDDVRELRDSARYQPSSAKYKIYIIDEVHMLSVNAFNALLKILEEPPAHVRFIFATTEAHKIPKTILSRCQRYDFKRVSVPVIHQSLKEIAAKEKLNIDDDALLLIAELADGGMRDSQSLTEQVLASMRESYTASEVAEILGVVSHQAVKKLCDAIIKAQIAEALLIVKEVHESGLDLCQLSDALASSFRVLSLCAHVDSFNQVEKLVSGLDEEFFHYAKKHDKADLKRLFAMALDGLSQVFQAKKPLLAMELLVLRMSNRPAIEDATTINFCLNKLDAILHNRPVPLDLPVTAKALNQNLGEIRPVLSEPLKKNIKIDNKEPETPKTHKPEARSCEPGPEKHLSLLERFSRMIVALAVIEPKLAACLRHAEPKLEGNVLELSFALTLYFEEVQKNLSNKDLIVLVKKNLGENIRLEAVLKQGEENKESNTPAAQEAKILAKEKLDLKNQVEQDPLVKRAMEIFGAKISSIEKPKS